MAELDPSERQLAEWLTGARRVMAFCGAGVSAESGVPTFRGAGGLWEGHSIEEVATPEAFDRNPLLVWRFYALRQQGVVQVRPNPAHYALAAIERSHAQFLLVTQNIDNLHERAGSRKLIKLHGNLMEARCTRCKAVHPLAEPVSLSEIEQGALPRCGCGGLLRPNVVWFGELLNRDHLYRIQEFIAQSLGSSGGPGEAVLLVIGTSGSVSGGYGITGLARHSGMKVVEINPERSHLSEDADLVLAQPAGELFGRVMPAVLGEDWLSSR